MRQEFDAVQLKARKKRTILSALISFILIPLTIFVGIVFLDDQRYLLVSLFIVVYTMIPFFLVYENRKPKAREIVTIAMMSAIVVFFNMISYMMTPLSAGNGLGDHHRHRLRTGSRVPHRRFGPPDIERVHAAGPLDPLADVLLGAAGLSSRDHLQ